MFSAALDTVLIQAENSVSSVPETASARGRVNNIIPALKELTVQWRTELFK